VKFGLRLIQWLGPPERLVELAVLAEQEGFDEVWFPHDPFMYNTWALASAVGARTSRITVASIATNPYTTDPSEIATFLATLDLLSGGRAAIGIGLHTDAMVGWTGHDASDRLERTRVAVDVVRRLLRGETVSGRVGPYEWSTECFLRFAPLRPDPPVFVAAWEPEYLALSGEIGDGSLPMITPPESAALMAEPILAGARRAGRDPRERDIAGGAWLSISAEPAAPPPILRAMVAYFGPYLEAPALATVGLSPEDFAPLRELVDADRLDEACAAVTDEMLQLALIGTPETIVERVQALAEAGVTQVNLGGPLGPDPEEAIRLVGREVIPHFRAA
jgi:5,10-methylenetetrahydromethanopterin reductase